MLQGSVGCSQSRSPGLGVGPGVAGTGRGLTGTGGARRGPSSGCS